MLIAFLSVTPLVVLFSLGYKFNWDTKKFLKTGAITIETFPKDAAIILDNERMDRVTPAIFREVAPRTYPLILEKEGFYPYKKIIEVNPSSITKVDVVLLPKPGYAQKVDFDANVYRFFLVRHIFGEKIIAFTGSGVFQLGGDFKNARMICAQDLGPEFAAGLGGLEEYNNGFIFWDSHHVWMLEFPEAQREVCADILLVYKADEKIQKVFLGIKDKYAIVHDGRKVVAVDIQNPAASFLVRRLISSVAAVYYDSRSEVLYFRDKAAGTDTYSIFRIELMPVIGERKEYEEGP